MTTAELARAINSPDGAIRDNVHRLLAYRQARAGAPVLVELIKNILVSPLAGCEGSARSTA